MTPLEILNALLSAPPVTLALIIVGLIAWVFRSFITSAAQAHNANTELALSLTNRNKELNIKVESMTRETGVLSAEIYRLRVLLNDCLNHRGETYS